MEFQHEPVLLDACIDNLNIRPGGIYVDGTIGGGGHASRICEALAAGGGGTLVGIDRDPEALAAAEKRLAPYAVEKHFVRGEYADIRGILRTLGIGSVDGALLDIGVSSYQLDNPARGFSYMHDAPLDMRMDPSQPLTARDVVNTYTEQDLCDVIRRYGEERWASRIAQFIVRERKKQPIETTSQLVGVIKAAIPASARRSGPHPAKRTFQAIRIEVNDELGQLERAVDDFCDVLAPGGRLCIITFHSLEDRIVKQRFARRADPCTCPPELPVCVCGKVADVRKITKKPITATGDELKKNPRARSAKLRVLEKLEISD